MNIRPAVRRLSVSVDEERRHRTRLLLDQLASRVIALGGAGVFGAMVLILLYLAWVALPLFAGAQATARPLGERPDWARAETRWLALGERGEVGLRIDGNGAAGFFKLDGLADLGQQALTPPGATRLIVAAADRGRGGLTALAFDSGEVRLLRERYRLVYGDGPASRRIEPSIEFPLGEAPLMLAPGMTLERLALADAPERLALAGLARGTVYLLLGDKREDLLSGETRLDVHRRDLAPDFQPTALALAGDARTLYLGADDGSVHAYSLPALESTGVVRLPGGAITAMDMLLGGVSLLAGDRSGAITQLFPVRTGDAPPRLTAVRSLQAHQAPIVALFPEQRRRGFLALDADGRLGVHHSTSERTLLMLDMDAERRSLALAPRGDGFLQLDPAGRLSRVQIENHHPEVSLRTLWGKVWYENYPEPRHIWQSTAATNDFEPKFSLTPLAFGTLKAALYAMLFAIPLALAGAAYTAVFMAPALRRKVKPTVELMAALPTVILGFLAGLWLAPFVEEHLAALLLLLLLLPPALVAFGWAWTRAPGPLTRWLPDGWQPLLLLPVIVLAAWLTLLLAAPLQSALFGAEFTTWLTEQAGVGYDQRNAIVVGIAMGFSITPTIFSLAEDALYAVPRSLSDGSLALGATRWQTLTQVILPTASPGIFSGVMIGFGRAVGETMIVLMATGNTPIMDWGPFEGMRTLSANIAIEMPESEVYSTHYRILFLSALVLFLFTFLVNTGAELVRQRLRARYSKL